MDLKKVSALAKLSIDERKKKEFGEQFKETLEVVDKLSKINTEKTKETSQVTGLTNVFREDKIEAGRILSQEAALGNAKRTHNGYFVVEALFDEQ